MERPNPAPEVVELAALLAPFLPDGPPTPESVAVAVEAARESWWDFFTRMSSAGTDFRDGVVSMLADRTWAEFNAERLVGRWQR